MAGSIGVKFFQQPLKTWFCSSRKKQDVHGNQYSDCVIQTCNRIGNAFALNFVQEKWREREREREWVIICINYFKMSFEKTLMQSLIFMRNRISVCYWYISSSALVQFFLPYKYYDVNQVKTDGNIQTRMSFAVGTSLSNLVLNNCKS